MKNKLKVLLLFDTPSVFFRGHDFKEEFSSPGWSTEKDVYNALVDNGYEVRSLGLYNNIFVLLEEVKESKPDIVFNLAEVFGDKSHLDKNVVWFLEMLKVPYTGASPTSLLICNNKALTKKILSFHRIRVPNFHTFYIGKKVWQPKKLKPPFIVKPLGEEASRGIAQSSIVDNEESLVDRVKFIHGRMKKDAIVEEFIEGRELYVSVFGSNRVKVFPPTEMKFGTLPEEESRIATYKAKWDTEYRKKYGIKNVYAGRLPNGMNKKIEDICKRAYKALNMRSYARFDIRINGDFIYILEANANPCLGKNEDFSDSADKAGIKYNKLVKDIISFGFKRNI